jgi:hypothetical protein
MDATVRPSALYRRQHLSSRGEDGRAQDMNNMLEDLNLAHDKFKKALDGFANEIQFNKDFEELEKFSAEILDQALTIIYLFSVDREYELGHDPRYNDVFKKRIVDINKLRLQAIHQVEILDLVEYVKTLKKLAHKIVRLVELTDTYIKTGEITQKEEKPKQENKRYRIEEQFDQWKSWVKDYESGMEYYEPLQPFIEDKDRQNRLADMVKKLKKIRKEK